MTPLAAIRGHGYGHRLLISIVVGAAAGLAAGTRMAPALAGTLGWVMGVAAFLGLTGLVIAGATREHMRARARALDLRASVIFVVIVAAAAASLGALAYLLHKPEAGTPLPAGRLALVCLAIAASWFLAHTSFALHYAHTFYDDPGAGGGGAEQGGLIFPGDAPPDYWDFLYYSYVVGMTGQVSDVQVTSRRMRRLTLAHGVLSFFFNTGILALAINIVAGAL